MRLLAADDEARHHSLLALIRACSASCCPASKRRAARCSRRSDNVFATFSEVTKAVSAAQDIMAELALRNRGLPRTGRAREYRIGYGPILGGRPRRIWERDELASKLGEDLAEAGDVFLTEAAFARMGPKNGGARHSRPCPVCASGTTPRASVPRPSDSAAQHRSRQSSRSMPGIASCEWVALARVALGLTGRDYQYAALTCID